MRAGELRHLVTIEAPTTTRDAYGGVVTSWATHVSAWAKIEHAGGSETMGPDALASVDRHIITIRHQSGITPDMRVNFGGRIFDIQSINNALEIGRMLAMQCVERHDISSGGVSDVSGFDSGFSIGFG